MLDDQPARLLIDVRDDDQLRGFHVLASLSLIADQLKPVELYRLGGNTPDEDIACRVFSFDTGLRLRPLWRLALMDSKFDLCVSAANTFPRDTASLAARRTSRQTITGIMFDKFEHHPADNLTLIDGHDTSAMARAVLDVLEASQRMRKP